MGSFPPKKGAAYTFYVSLIERSTGLIKANPTLATGDAKISKDGGAFNNLTTLPDAYPAAGKAVRIQLSEDEMNANDVQVALVDAAGAEWDDLFVSLQTSYYQIDDLLPATGYTAPDNLTLSSISARMGTFTGTGVNNVAGFLRALASKAATLPSDIGGTFDPATDSVEAIRDTAPLGTAMRGTDGALLASGYTAPPSASDIATAVWGATTRTLTSFGTLIADIWSYATRTITSGGITAAEIWTYAARTLTQTAAQIVAVLAGTALVIQRGDTLSINFTDLGNVSGRTKLYFTLKASTTETDAEALVQIEETGGLLRINGAAATTAANGDIVVSDAASGDLIVSLAAVETAKLAENQGLVYDLQMISAAGVTTLTRGAAAVNGDVTRTTS